MTTNDNKLDMSLDEIIKMDNIQARKPGFRPRRGGFRPRGSGGGFRSGGFRSNNNNYQSRSFGQLPRNAGLNSNNGYRRRSDGYDNSFGGGARRSATLHISNLAPTVTTDDIEELFAGFGNLSKALVHFDQYGNSLHTAEVVFERRSEAIEAKNKLHQVPLDGKALKITLLEDRSSDAFTSTLRNTNRPAPYNRGPRSYNNNGYQNRNNYQNGGGGGFRRNNYSHNNNHQNRRSTVTAEDLDKELDLYRSQAESDDLMLS